MTERIYLVAVVEQKEIRNADIISYINFNCSNDISCLRNQIAPLITLKHFSYSCISGLLSVF
jgi:hypothetical protein